MSAVKLSAELRHEADEFQRWAPSRWESSGTEGFLKLAQLLRRAANVIDHLEQEVADYEGSFTLYHEAMKRGERMWHEATGAVDIGPDSAQLMAWVLGEWDRAKQEIQRLTANLTDFAKELDVREP